MEVAQQAEEAFTHRKLKVRNAKFRLAIFSMVLGSFKGHGVV